MKLLTLLSALIYGLFLLLIIPYFLIQQNTKFNLPTYSFLFFKILGLGLIAVGMSIWLYCIDLFNFLGKGTPVPINPPKKLVIKGIYRFTRNPMYIGVLIILTGYFLLFGHFLLLIYPFLAAIFFNLLVKFYEEPTLKKKFGQSYIEYCKKAPRWV